MTGLLIKSVTHSLLGEKDHYELLSRLSSAAGTAMCALDEQKRKGVSFVSEIMKSIVQSCAVGIEKINMDLDSDIVTLADIKAAYKYLHENRIIVRTPTLMHVQSLFRDDNPGLTENDSFNFPEIPDSVDLYLKMENMQTTGSFKIRGCANQMGKLEKEHDGEGHGKRKQKLVTFSGGNYGKAFAHCVSRLDVEATCIMPVTVPPNRVTTVQGYGVDVKLVPTESLSSEVDKFVGDGYQLFHSFNDVTLIAGNGSAGLELLEDVPKPDIVLVCCGGGGLVSGVASAISLSGLKNCRVYGVEPEGAATMFESFKNRRPMSISGVKSVATGLCPPYAGSLCYKHCRWFVEDILIVSDQEILTAMRMLFHRGIKAESSGCAAMAALLFNKVPDVEGKKVAVFITGGNVSTSELVTQIQDGAA